jgi:8-oxo-dGTP diphosphatase
MIQSTLCYIITEGKILLIRKKKGFGAGKYNGAGGKIKEGETPSIAAVREFEEEAGIVPLDMEHMGTLAFFYGQEEKADWIVHIFLAKKFMGDPINTEEADPEWFGLEKIPYDSMWPDDRIWMPLLLEGKKFMGKFFFDKEMKAILKHEIVSLASV